MKPPSRIDQAHSQLEETQTFDNGGNNDNVRIQQCSSNVVIHEDQL